ncbi:MAG: PIG-L family deacetylase [Actinomycetota bacterium]|nr:PIG-L family deacetylase [Actinomycetota bacterium]
MDVVCYVAGHPDDALLFRGEVLYSDLHTPDATVVHIVVSAGDAGRTDGWWQAREQAAVAALRSTLSPDPVLEDTVVVSPQLRSHGIRRYRAPGFACYCLRLPDGNVDGAGFPATQRRTLGKLQTGQVASLPAVDGSTAYQGWSDLRDTLRALIARERQGMATLRPWVNTSDPSRALNPGDHPDHYATADAIDYFARADGLNRAWWVSYDTQQRAANLTGLGLLVKRMLFYSHGYDLQARTGTPANDTEWDWWGAKSYARTETT